MSGAAVVILYGEEAVVGVTVAGVGVTYVGVVVTLVVRGGAEDTPSGEACRKLKDSGSQEIPEGVYDTLLGEVVRSEEVE